MSLIEMTVKGFVEKLGSDSPAPGGGSAAALSGAMGASLVSMVCRLTLGKAKYVELEPLAKDVLAKSDLLVQRLLESIQKDTNAFDAVLIAFAMPKETDAEKAQRSAAIQAAYKVAIETPKATAEDCLEVLRLACSLVNRSNPNAASDLAVGVMQAYAGIRGAFDNVEINLPSVKDAAYVAREEAWMARTEQEALDCLHTVQTEVARRLS